MYEELKKKKDELSEWAKKNESFFLKLDDGTHKKQKEVATYITNKYNKEEEKIIFLGGADSYLIAYAKCHGMTVVTLEKPEDSPKIKIPNICEHFEVLCCNTFEMLEKKGVRFILEKIEV